MLFAAAANAGLDVGAFEGFRHAGGDLRAGTTLGLGLRSPEIRGRGDRASRSSLVVDANFTVDRADRERGPDHGADEEDSDREADCGTCHEDCDVS